jgi:DNA polymerase sigma
VFFEAKKAEIQKHYMRDLDNEDTAG